MRLQIEDMRKLKEEAKTNEKDISTEEIRKSIEEIEKEDVFDETMRSKFNYKYS